MSGRLADKVAVVTGGANGTGRTYAGRLAAEGANVAVLDIADAAGTVADVHTAGAKGAAFVVDVTDPEQVSRAAEEVAAALGRRGAGAASST